MSAPVSPIRSWALVTPKPGMPSSWAICRSYGSRKMVILSSGTPIWAVQRLMLSSIICRTKAWSPVKNEQSRASRSWAIFRRIRVRAFGVALAGDDGARHVPAGHAVDVADHGRQLQVRVLRQLLAARFPGGAGLDQPPAVAGVRAEPADVPRRHEAARQRSLPGDPGQPGRVQPAGLRPPGQRLDL
jgi:hypothetical protein